MSAPRPGPGRPPRETPRLSVTIRLEPADKVAFDLLCSTTGCSQSKLLAAWIQAATEGAAWMAEMEAWQGRGREDGAGNGPKKPVGRS